MKQRRFKIANLRDWVIEHRAEMLVDALTVIRGYQQVDPIGVVALPSFERWSRLCRDPLLWLGLADPCDTQTETDDETSSIAGIFQILANAFATRPFTSLDISRFAGGVADSDGNLSATMMASGCAEPTSALKVGYWLREQRDKLGAGYKLVNVGKGMYGVRWQLKPIVMNGDLE